MKEIEQNYEAEVANFGKTMIESHGGNSGFKVPEYQREYEWDNQNLERLIHDCHNGFFQLSTLKKGQNQSFTFLGTVIVVVEEKPEFGGRSLILVDGQQRITTLLLLCCAMFDEIHELTKDENLDGFDNTTDEINAWLVSEKEQILNNLRRCAVGSIPTFSGDNYQFPRIIRSADSRNEQHSEYVSNLGRFLDIFIQLSKTNDISRLDTDLQELEIRDTQMKKTIANYRRLKGHVVDIYSCSKNLEFHVEGKNFKTHFMKNLLNTLSNYDYSKQDKFIDRIIENPETDKIIRILMFANYLLKYVVLTRVETSDEESAFDIFEALNTTGIPLTGIETLKPLVVRFEDGRKGYPSSPSEDHFKRLEKSIFEIRDFEKDNSKIQKSTKELVTSFANYFDGSKLGFDLRHQRGYLRQKYERLNNSNAKVDFIKAFADLAQFRKENWLREGDCCSHIDLNLDQDTQIFKVCFALLRSMKTNLSVPILARYWWNFKDQEEGSIEDNFLPALKALTSYVVLRRTFTGGTANIDNELRGIMYEPESCGLCLGEQLSNEMWSVEKLKSKLWSLLIELHNKKNLELNRENWISIAKEVPIYDHSQPLSKFLLLAAHDQAKPSGISPSNLVRDGISDHGLEFLAIRRWNDQKYETIEHIVPQKQSPGWNEKFYGTGSSVLHTIGNLTLLPLKENSSVDNAEWGRKKLLYKVFAARTEIEKNEAIQLAQAAGLNPRPQTIELLDGQSRSMILDSVIDVDYWTLELVEKRSENLLTLVWDKIAGWVQSNE